MRKNKKPDVKHILFLTLVIGPSISSQKRTGRKSGVTGDPNGGLRQRTGFPRTGGRGLLEEDTFVSWDSIYAKERREPLIIWGQTAESFQFGRKKGILN